MNRKQFDKLASTTGLLLAVVLVVAGALLSWGGSFASGQVKDQLTQQKITFPGANDTALKSLPAEHRAAMAKYAGMKMTTGDQANTYANHFIAVHMGYVAGGKVYEEVSNEFLAASAQLKATPDDKALAAKVAMLGQQRTTLFMGSTLRGLLGFTFAFGMLGKIAIIASYVTYAGGLLFFILALLGFAHLRRAATDSEI